MTIRPPFIALLTMVVLLGGPRSGAQSASAQKSKTTSISATVDPVRALIAEFDRVTLVGLGERHSCLEDSEFRLKLIRDPEFAQKVKDIVIEFANPRYQNVLDRFVDGGDVPHGELSMVWQGTTQRANGGWGSPVYEEFISTVRSVNAALPASDRLRIIAGDFPADWSAIDAENAKAFPRADVIKELWKNVSGDRDASAANIITREVLNERRKALVIFGSGHFSRNDPRTIVSLLKGDLRATWFVVAPTGGDGLPIAIRSHIATSKKPALLVTNGAVGKIYAGYLSWDKKGWDESPSRTTLRQLVDAILYFGEALPRYDFGRPPRAGQ
jgi:hypothetical protein